MMALRYQWRIALILLAVDVPVGWLLLRAGREFHPGDPWFLVAFALNTTLAMLLVRRWRHHEEEPDPPVATDPGR